MSDEKKRQIGEFVRAVMNGEEPHDLVIEGQTIVTRAEVLATCATADMKGSMFVDSTAAKAIRVDPQN